MKLFGKGIKIGIIDSGVDYTVSWRPSFRIELLEKNIPHHKRVFTYLIFKFNFSSILRLEAALAQAARLPMELTLWATMVTVPTMTPNLTAMAMVNSVFHLFSPKHLKVCYAKG